MQDKGVKVISSMHKADCLSKNKQQYQSFQEKPKTTYTHIYIQATGPSAEEIWEED